MRYQMVTRRIFAPNAFINRVRKAGLLAASGPLVFNCYGISRSILVKFASFGILQLCDA